MEIFQNGAQSKTRLIIFSLNWQELDIDKQISAANREMNALAKEKGVDCRINFNLAGLGFGGGERIASDRKDYPAPLSMPESNPQDKSLTGEVLDELRRHNARLIQELSEDRAFKLFRDASQMLSRLKSRHDDNNFPMFQLAAVFSEATDIAREKMIRARVLDYFEDSIYGPDSVDPSGGKVNMQVIFRHAMKSEKFKQPYETIIISDNPETAQAAKPINPWALIEADAISTICAKVEKQFKLSDPK